jgi:hypothetical protein
MQVLTKGLMSPMLQFVGLNVMQVDFSCMSELFMGSSYVLFCCRESKGYEEDQGTNDWVVFLSFFLKNPTITLGGTSDSVFCLGIIICS